MNSKSSRVVSNIPLYQTSMYILCTLLVLSRESEEGRFPIFFTFAMPKVCLNYIATKMRHVLADTRDKTKY